MQLVLAVVFLIFLAGYVIPNILVYPWQSLTLIVACIGVTMVADGGERVMGRLRASQHPALRRYLSAHDKFFAIFNGVPPYNEGRWWLRRTLVQGVFWVVMLAAALAVLVALGAVLEWIDPKKP